MTSLDKGTFKPNLILGYTDRNHLMLDIDHTGLSKVRWLVNWIQELYPNVGDCLIMCSSERKDEGEVRRNLIRSSVLKKQYSSYHLIFNNRLGYNTCCDIIEFLANLKVLERSFLYMRHFRGDITLRVSPSVFSYGVKHAPKPCEYVYSQFTNRRDGYIGRYFRFYLIACNLLFSGKYPKTKAYDGGNSTNDSAKQDSVYTVQHSYKLDKCEAYNTCEGY